MDLDEQPTAFLSSSVRDAVREGLAHAALRAVEPRPVVAAPTVSTPTHVLRVDHRAASTPPPVQSHAAPTHDGPFFATPPSVGALSAEPMSLPRLSDAVPLYGVGKASRETATDPTSSRASVAPSSSTLANLWREANGVRKATMVLLPVALAGFAFVVYAPEPPTPKARTEAPTAFVPASAPAAPAETEALTPRLLAGSNGLAKAPDGGVTLERRVVDAVTAHRLEEAAVLYKELAASDSKNAAIAAAAHVLAAPPTAPR
jgi:hypothetical protein